MGTPQDDHGTLDKIINEWTSDKDQDSVSVITDHNGKTLSYIPYNGHYLPAVKGIRENIERGDEFVSRPDDIWICCYAKSGTHWLWEIVHMLLGNSTDYTSKPKETTQFDFHDAASFTNLPSPRVFNCALWWHQLPRDVIQKKSKILHCMRNPKDVAVSYYLHTKELHSVYQYSGSWEGWVQLFTEGKVVRGSWFDYEMEWSKEGGKDENVLTLMYEDLKKDLVSEIKVIAHFLGVSLPESRYLEMADRCSFGTMKQCKQMSEMENKIMYRKGQVGDWKNWFTVTQNEKFDAVYKAWLESGGPAMCFG
ncbi:sulfotransferase family cytosolic 1B member 1 [Lingula anatina]|uniref:Sulfotransferase family cytosolic 1B member 1 n=1 Tax=Lingula anatina TaxID=7574 RepID=A0A1S3K7N4_LINAN|nr:sulfotransferase family cytosolic 1B member 1 [Lingula anatina]XP_013418273.1 sulfotransferase family cytosolic 1B member 1 [Lingula anatina]|eukprot:XP_013418271.1 sulfotransferase family cytosolic 1B member 1 [Lingula anatina]